ncbi:MAG: hypothetical protein ACE366_26660 [Bradymonadia bacterium]
MNVGPNIADVVLEGFSTLPEEPISFDLAAAIISDVLRQGTRRPVTDDLWRRWLQQGTPHQQHIVCVVARALAHTGLRAATVSAVQRMAHWNPDATLGHFIELVGEIDLKTLKRDRATQQYFCGAWLTAWSDEGSAS